MARSGWGKSAGWVTITLLSRLLTVIAQPGFLSIDCGGTTNYTAENNITWITDTNYIDVGERADLADANQLAYDAYLQSLRVFRKPLNKSCYYLPVVPNVPYLLRLWFALGNYSALQSMSSFEFAISIETVGMLFVQNISITNLISITPIKHEKVLVSLGKVLYICLIRTSENNDPFISAIELRTFRDGMYPQAKPGSTMLSLYSRYDFGANSSVRYPQDEFDRLWIADNDAGAFTVPQGVQRASVQEPISTNNTQDLPPTVVMQTAWITNSDPLRFYMQGPLDKPLLLLYFADIEPVNTTFSVLVNGQLISEISMMRNYSALERTFLLNDTQTSLVVTLANSTRSLLLNAFEIYSVFDTELATYSEDVEALEVLKMNFGITDWISDPCYLIPWKGIGCDNSSSSIRISEINLSGWNLSGWVPKNIGELSALVNMSIENNHLTGPLPNFSNLTMLERIHLQNNNFTGRIPEWLTGLQNLKELFIENNSFNGVIPAQLLSNPSLIFRYSGNQHLYIPSKPNKDRVKLTLEVTLSGTVVIILLIVGIVVHHKKSRRNGSSKLDEDNSMIMVPKSTKTRAFTLEEIIVATQNFSQKIGQGGFGSVFFGKLNQGKPVAVKVLSLFSKQGVQEFLNEVNLLSTVHHKNLVSLLGYCNESRELMLIYEHMSGRFLRDRLYGLSSELNWKTRLKIAVDAAQGLEYLHVGCNPKIIHRDVKTSNILLDNNMTGKIADFGLSKLTTAGEASHFTCTIVKGTLGYLDPAYLRTQMLTEKSDVYSFGVVLLELICGRSPINVNQPEDELGLVQWVTQNVGMGDNPTEIAGVIDEKLAVNYNMKSVTQVVKLALRCVHDRPSYRPSTSEVVAEIKSAYMHESHIPISNSEGIPYLEAGPNCSQVNDMKWSDNSSNLSQVGR